MSTWGILARFKTLYQICRSFPRFNHRPLLRFNHSSGMFNWSHTVHPYGDNLPFSLLYVLFRDLNLSTSHSWMSPWCVYHLQTSLRWAVVNTGNTGEHRDQSRWSLRMHFLMKHRWMFPEARNDKLSLETAVSTDTRKLYASERADILTQRIRYRTCAL